MIVTEEEAKTKRCPEVFGHMIPTASVPSQCVGSSCMAWRWHWSLVNNRHEHVLTPDGGKLGYCGKAGAP
jgi:hypothetical protein